MQNSKATAAPQNAVTQAFVYSARSHTRTNYCFKHITGQFLLLHPSITSINPFWFPPHAQTCTHTTTIYYLSTADVIEGVNMKKGGNEKKGEK